jgi:site-specific DNA-methyltransferase (adenine-specific)
MDGPFHCVAGDARDETAYRAALGGERADLLLTDPPYCLLTRRRRGGELRDKHDRKIDREPALRFETVRDYRRFTEEWMGLAVRHVRAGRPLVVWTNSLGKDVVASTARALGYPSLWGELVWAKRTTERRGNEQLLRVYEVALVLGQVPPPEPTLDAPPSCWSAVTGYDDEGDGARWGAHPHHKPFGALEPLVRAYSRPGELVLDPFAGSGSIAVAAARLGRRAACMELRPEWAETVSARLGSTLPRRS